METKENAGKAVSAKEKTELDSNAIYLGNLNTVDADLKLPLMGIMDLISVGNRKRLFL
ncbi:hypothetical protein D3C75_771830 [compost metagenome]